MNEEVRVATNRLRKQYGYGLDWLRDGDRKLAADAYLAEHPADDDKAATVEWIESVGFVQTHSFAWRLVANEKFSFHHDANITQFSVEGVWHVKDPTRGDIRGVCRAMRIELRERT